MSGPLGKTLGAQARTLFRLAVPIAAAQAGFALMTLVDTAVVGRLGAQSLAALGVANSAFFAVVVIGMGVMMGLDPLVSQAIGARDFFRARQLLWQGVWLALGSSAVLLLVFAAIVPVLLNAGLPPDTARDAVRYLWLRVPGVLPILLFTALRSFLQAAGRVAPLVVAMVLANIANFLLDLLFVFGGAHLGGWAGPLRLVPAMGAGGSAVATSICSGLQVLILLVGARSILVAGQRPTRRPVPRDLLAAARIGVPVGLQLTAEVSVFALVGVLVGRLGDGPMAAHQVALSLASFTFCFAVGIGQAGSVLVGWGVGARDTPSARRAGLIAFAAGGGFMALCGVIFWLWPTPLARLLSDQPAVVAATAPLLVVAAVFQISDGVQAVGAGVLRGTGDTHYAFVANLVGHYGVGLPLALLFGFTLNGGVVGLWWGLCAGLTAVGAALFARFWVRSSREIKPLEPHPVADRVELG